MDKFFQMFEFENI